MKNAEWMCVLLISLTGVGCGSSAEKVDCGEHEATDVISTDSSGEEADTTMQSWPAEVEAIITPESLARFQELGLRVNGGVDPPEVEEGRYRAEELDVLHSDFESKDAPEYCSFTVRHEDEAVSLQQGCSWGREPQQYELEAVSAGSERCFSMFVEYRASIDGCPVQTVKVLSACQSPDGLEGVQLGERYYFTGQGSDECRERDGEVIWRVMEDADPVISPEPVPRY